MSRYVTEGHDDIILGQLGVNQSPPHSHMVDLDMPLKNHNFVAHEHYSPAHVAAGVG